MAGPGLFTAVENEAADGGGCLRAVRVGAFGSDRGEICRVVWLIERGREEAVAAPESYATVNPETFLPALPSIDGVINEIFVREALNCSTRLSILDLLLYWIVIVPVGLRHVASACNTAGKPTRMVTYNTSREAYK